ncbi:AI-2E family transporter [Flexithrix dorotheae]|uniref:AI-2E family transporter n=1 Tax=Flexithrix dorotheae TaxID=70993 RepID=UPI000360589D|nr:AI-2E family transporter [Flexithrix dorotheae]
MAKFTINKTAVNLALLIFSLGLLAWIFSEIVVYIVIALVLSAILRTPTNYISQFQFYGLKVPQLIATIIAFCLLIGLITLFVYLFVPLVTTQVQVLSSLDLEKWTGYIMVPVESVEDFLIKNDIVDEKKGFLIETLKNNIRILVEQFQFTQILNSILSVTSSFLVGAMAVFFITFFILYEKGLFRRHLISLIPNRYFEVSISALSKIEKLLSNYLLGLLLQMVSIFSIASFGLLIVGIEYALTIAVFAAVANLIPYLGPILGASFGLIVGFSTSPDLVTSQDYVFLISKILAVFGVVQVTDNIFLQPIIFSKSVKAHPLEIFLIVFVGATLSGPVGMIAAIPSYTILKVSMVEFYKGYQQYQIFRN